MIYYLTNTLATSQRLRCGHFFPRTKEENSRGKKERGKEKGQSNSRRDYVCTVTAKIPRCRRGYDTDFPRVFRPAGKRNGGEIPATRRECGERRDSHRAARARARTRAVEHLFEMIPRCLIAQADIIPRAGKRDDFKQRKPPGEA